MWVDHIQDCNPKNFHSDRRIPIPQKPIIDCLILLLKILQPGHIIREVPGLGPINIRIGQQNDNTTIHKYRERRSLSDRSCLLRLRRVSQKNNHFFQQVSLNLINNRNHKRAGAIQPILQNQISQIIIADLTSPRPLPPLPYQLIISKLFTETVNLTFPLLPCKLRIFNFRYQYLIFRAIFDDNVCSCLIDGKNENEAKYCHDSEKHKNA
jgi:hypothetical protein